MFNYIIKFSLLTVISFSVSAEDNNVKMYDKGLDGNMRVYSIACPNGKKTVITQMFGAHGKSQRSIGAINNTRELQLEEQEESEISGTDLSGGSDEIPTGQSTNSLSQTTSNLKQKFLNLVGQGNRAEVCLYPIGRQKNCKTYKNLDAAAKAACDLIQ
jgi:hypothetical protein